MATLKKSVWSILLVILLFVSARCGISDTQTAQIPQTPLVETSVPKTIVDTSVISTATIIENTQEPTITPYYIPKQSYTLIPEEQTIVALYPEKDPRGYDRVPSQGDTPTRTPLPPGVPLPTLPPPSFSRTPIADGNAGWLFDQPWINSAYMLSNGWYIKQGEITYSVYAGYMSVQGPKPEHKQGVLIKKIRSYDREHDQDVVINSYIHTFSEVSGSMRIIDVTVTNTSMQVTVQSEYGQKYRFDVLNETIEELQP